MTSLCMGVADNANQKSKRSSLFSFFSYEKENICLISTDNMSKSRRYNNNDLLRENKI